MNKILRKLRSKAGESMILAMVFMLFCVFVGGSVLASATANAYRVEHLSDQQDFLSQRSAVKLISDDLKGKSDKDQLLIITDMDRVVQEVEILSNGSTRPIGNKHNVRTVTFKAPFSSELKMTPFQRVAYEATVWQYLKTNNLCPSSSPVTGYQSVLVRLEGFYYESNITSMSQFWLQYGLSSELKVGGEVTIEGLDMAQIPTYFESCEGERLYDFAVSFGDYSQMTLSMTASYGERASAELSIIKNFKYSPDGVTVKNYDAAELTINLRQAAIYWADPLIEKGGV